MANYRASHGNRVLDSWTSDEVIMERNKCIISADPHVVVVLTKKMLSRITNDSSCD